MKRTLVLVAGALLLASSSARGGNRFGWLTTVQLEKGMGVDAATLADVDGDGKRDLVVSAHSGSFDRHLLIYLRRSGEVAFPAKPDRDLAFLPGDIAFCPGDVDPAPGDEILIFSASGIYVWKTASPGERGIYRLGHDEFLWQISHPREVFLFRDGVRDVDGDGLDDVVVPEATGYRIFFQDGSARPGNRFVRSSFLRIPDYQPVAGRETVAAARARLKGLRLTLSVGEGESRADDFLSVRDVVPYPVFEDFDGDGRKDLLAETSSELLVWLQTPAGGFAEQPSVRLPLPVAIDTARRLDVSFKAEARDLDGDGKADYLLVGGDRYSKEARTQVLVYEHHGTHLFGEKGAPNQLLVLAGFARLLGLTDVDGNGLPDLVMGSVRVDTLDLIKVATNGDLNAELLVYLNHDGKFSPRPDLSLTIPIPAKDVEKAGKSVTANFLGDLTGTGTSDLLVRDDPERIRLLAVRRSGQKLAVLSDPLFETRIDRRADVQIERNGGPPEILVLEDHQILHVRFTR